MIKNAEREPQHVLFLYKILAQLAQQRELCFMDQAKFLGVGRLMSSNRIHAFFFFVPWGAAPPSVIE
jgi:hypothetical protein